jgi:phenylpropionate dioxygenase-like ring-hydroxylating dioxygenase large terminal subunit
MFLKNAWYVAAWDHELREGPLPATILGENIVLFRRKDGQAAALANQCPHRRLPLSMGRVQDGELECGYHGLTFNHAGDCTRAPCADQLPERARVRAYPIEERYGLLWIWMGAPEAADPASIFPVEHWGDLAWGCNRGGSMEVGCNYLHITDNLLDPSHVAWVHRTSFASAACEATPLHVDAADDGMTVSRWMMDSEVPPFYAPFVQFQGRCDRKQHYEVRYPALALIKAVLAPAGTGGEGRPLPAETFIMDSYNFMTPVDAHRTRYYWFQMRNFAPGDERVSEAMATSVRAAFEEDRVILEAVHRGMGDEPYPGVAMPIDRGPMQFRRRLKRVIAMEAGQYEPAPATVV